MDAKPENPQVTKTDLDKFLAVAQAKVTANYKGDDDCPILELMTGRRYVRVAEVTKRCDGKPERSVVCFIDLSNGDVLKAAGWDSPDKTTKNRVRGNIFDDQHGTGRVHIFGMITDQKT